jgi:2'-hydroxyisoflavone reductase
MRITRRTLLKGAVGYGASLAVFGSPRAAARQQAPDPVEPLTVLILGGTGFLGPHLVEAARGRGHVLTLFNRGRTNPHLFPELEKLRGDRDGDLEALEGRRWDAVIDTSGYVPRIVKASADLLAPNVGQYLFVSSISVFADPSVPGLDESGAVATIEDETSEDVRQHYGALKALCEQAAEAALPGRATNVRPGLIVGPLDPSDRFTYWPVRMARGGEVLCPGDGSDPVQYVDARDLAAWMISLLERRVFGVFNATGPAERLEMRPFLEGCRAGAGSEARLTWVDTDFLAEHSVAPWGDLPVWVPGQGESAGMSTVDCSKAIGEGLRFRPVDETARDTLAWFETLPEDRRATLRTGLSSEREAEVLAAWAARSR